MLLVRAGHGNELVEDFVHLGLVAVGWMKLGNLSLVSAADLETMLCEAYPDCVTASGRPRKHYAEIVQFAVEAKPGDLVATVDGARKCLIVGIIDGLYEFMSERPLWSGEEPYRHVLPVSWGYAVTRNKEGLQSFPETKLPGRSTYWLGEETTQAIMSSPRMSLSAYTKMTRLAPAEPAPQAMSEVPADTDSITLIRWLEQNERLAAELPLRELARRAEMASTSARKVESAGTVYIRDSFVAAYAKKLAQGTCDLCERDAPFYSVNGEPYLESHHVEWLSNGGHDSVDNVVALCPNCHRKMHIRDEKSDRGALLKRIADRI